LHGLKLIEILERLVEHYSWEQLAMKININCFKSDPSIKSSLKFLRKTPWARDKVERLYLWQGLTGKCPVPESFRLCNYAYNLPLALINKK
jgi:uncharacterized protein (DUF2132 family)